MLESTRVLTKWKGIAQEGLGLGDMLLATNMNLRTIVEDFKM